MSCPTIPATSLRKYFGIIQPTEHQRLAELGLFRDDLMRIVGQFYIATITGTIAISALAVGATAYYFQDHSASKTFCLAESARLTVQNGFNIHVLEMGVVGASTRITDGSGFVLKVENISGTTAAWTLSWSRRGIAG